MLFQLNKIGLGNLETIHNCSLEKSPLWSSTKNLKSISLSHTTDLPRRAHASLTGHAHVVMATVLDESEAFYL